MDNYVNIFKITFWSLLQQAFCGHFDFSSIAVLITSPIEVYKSWDDLGIKIETGNGSY